MAYFAENPRDIRSIPLQFKPGHPTIWPSAALVEYERGWHARLAQLKRAEDGAQWRDAMMLEQAAYRKAAATITGTGANWDHLQYQHDAFERQAALLRRRWSNAQPSWFSGPAPWVQQLAQQQREHAPAFLEQMYRQQQATDLALAQFNAALAAPRSPVPEPVSREPGQGMTRGHWRGGIVGRFPGYRP